MRLHHVGIACEDVDRAADLFGTLLETPVCHQESLESVATTFLELPAGYLELLEPIGEGPVARFLEREGPGIHHLAFETPAIEERLATADAAGIELIDDTPRRGAMGHRVAFLHPGDTGGVLLEYVEP